MNRHIIDNKGQIVSSTMPDICQDCIKKNVLQGFAYICCPLDGKSKRLAIKESSSGTVFVCSMEYVTTRDFLEVVESMANHIKTLQKINDDVKKESEDRLRIEQQERVDRVIHNLKNIYSHCNQELYNLVPQTTKSHRDALEVAKQEISKSIEKAARTIIRLQKLNVSIKAEISVYEKLIKNEGVLAKRFHNPRDVLMLVLNTFFGDFTKEGVYVEVDSCYEKVYFDFESVQVALYHIVENAVKYVKPESKIRVKFSIIGRKLIMAIEMCSIYTAPKEREKIFEEGYSGENAHKLQRHGKGIGMNRAKRLLELNSISLICLFGDAMTKENDVDYAINVFRIEFPLG